MSRRWRGVKARRARFYGPPLTTAPATPPPYLARRRTPPLPVTRAGRRGTFAIAPVPLGPGLRVVSARAVTRWTARESGPRWSAREAQ